MNFVSFSFVILFAVVFAARILIGRGKTEVPFVALLITASTIFCAWHVPAYLFIMLASIVTDYVAAILIDRCPPDSPLRKRYLFLSLSTNLGLLAFFKYGNFFLETAGSSRRLSLVLPMGISFYTFCSMSYTIDVYRRKLKPVGSFWRFYLFLTFFPHLVAGPIVRAEQFLHQIARRRRLCLRVFTEGAFLIIRGLFLKMVCADNLAAFVDASWDKGYAPGADAAMLATLVVCFAIQIFCDFEGYSSIARGLSYLLGYRLPVNFNNPYLAGSFKNFWERWHISLSQWLRDYLYLSLGGNRGSRWMTYRNLMLVMILGGLWHGANLTFVVWGFLHGLALAVERLIGFHDDRKRSGAVVRWAWYGVVQLVVLVAWVFFRSTTVAGAFRFLANIVEGLPHPGSAGAAAAILFLLPPVLLHVRGALTERGIGFTLRPACRAAVAAGMLFAVLTCYGKSNAFIYFQF